MHLPHQDFFISSLDRTFKKGKALASRLAPSAQASAHFICNGTPICAARALQLARAARALSRPGCPGNAREPFPPASGQSRQVGQARLRAWHGMRTCTTACRLLRMLRAVPTRCCSTNAPPPGHAKIYKACGAGEAGAIGRQAAF